MTVEIHAGSGSEGVERCSSPPCADTSCFLDVLHYGCHWGLSPWHSVQFSPLRDRAASDQGPGHSTVLTGSSLYGGLQ